MDCKEDEGGKVEELEGGADRVIGSDSLGEGQLVVVALGIDLSNKEISNSRGNLSEEANDWLNDLLGESQNDN